MGLSASSSYINFDRYTIFFNTFIIYFNNKGIFNDTSSGYTLRSERVSITRKRILADVANTIITEPEASSRRKQVSYRIDLGDGRLDHIIKIYLYIDGVRRNHIPVTVFGYKVSVIYSLNLIIDLLLDDDTTHFRVEHSKVVVQISDSSQRTS